jgi:hypothetical protein
MTDRLSRIILALLALVAVELGLWATFTPRAFYENFPGAGKHWVAIDGPYNEHLIRDFGGLNLALAVITIVALVKLTPVLVKTAAGAWFVWSLPHFIYHARHLERFDTADKIALISTLGLSVVGPVVLYLLQARTAAPQSTSNVPPARQ